MNQLLVVLELNLPDLPVEVDLISERSEGEVLIQDLSIKCGTLTVDLYKVSPSQFDHNPAALLIHWLETHAMDSNRDQFLPMAKLLAKQGIVSFLPDCFWSVDHDMYAEDPIQYTSRWWKTEPEHDRRLILSQLEKLLLVERYMTSLDIDLERTAIAGHDFGAMFGILLARYGIPYRGIGLMALTARFSDWFKFGTDIAGEDLEHFHDSLTDYAPITLIGELKGPKHFGFAIDDFYVPIETAQSIFELATEPKSLTWYQTDHSLNQQAFDDLQDFLVKLLNS